MSAGLLNLTIEQGADYLLALQFLDANSAPVDLTGYVMTMQVRPTVSDSLVLVELSTANGKIVITDPTNGEFQLQLTADDTATLCGSGVYDLKMVGPVADPATSRFIQGKVTISSQVTR